MASNRARARAAQYASNLERRQGTLTDDALIRHSPFVVVRSIELVCSLYGKTSIMGPVTMGDVRNAVKNLDCDGAHSLGIRTWSVISRSNGRFDPTMIMDRFNCILMAKALRDDLNTKAAMAIMRRESNANAGT